MIIGPKDAVKKECRNIGAPVLAGGVGGPRIVGFTFPNCSADKCMNWRWSAEYRNRGYCGRSGAPTNIVIEEILEEAPCQPLATGN